MYNRSQQNYIISETYDLLTEDDKCTHLKNGDRKKYLLTKPTYNNELKEIRFRSFKPVMRGNVDKLRNQSIKVSIQPHLFMTTDDTSRSRMKQVVVGSTNFQTIASYTINPDNCRDSHAQGIIIDRVTDTSFRLRMPSFYNSTVIIRGNNISDGAPVTYGIYFEGMNQTNPGFTNCAVFYRSAEYNFCEERFTASDTNATDSAGNKANLIMTDPYGDAVEFKIPNDADRATVIIKDIIIRNLLSTYTDSFTAMTMHFKNEHLDVTSSQLTPYLGPHTVKDNMLQSKFQLMTRANSHKIEIDKSAVTYECLLYDDVDHIIADINEKISGYCSNFKPSSTFHVICENKHFYLCDAYDEFGERKSTPVKKSISEYIAKFDKARAASAVEAKLSFAKIWKEDADDGNFIFGTSNMLFSLKDFDHLDENATIWLLFTIDLRVEMDIFNVGVHRQIHNCIEHVKFYNDKSRDPTLSYKYWWASDAIEFASVNQCIATNSMTKHNLLVAAYLARGMDLCLRSSIMHNLSNIIYTSYTENDPEAKRTQQTGTQNYTEVYITDMQNKPVDDAFLKSIYSAIYVDIDYVL